MAGIPAAAVVEGFNLIGNYFFNQENTRLQRQQLALQRRQYEINQGMYFLGAKETLYNIKEDYHIALLQIAEQEDLLSAYDTAIARFGNYYATQIGKAQAQGVEHFRAGMDSWQNQLTLAAERGQTGRTSDILAAIQRQSLVNYVGEDLTLDTEGGAYGNALTELMADLAAEKQEAISNRDILGKAIDVNKMTAQDYRDSVKDILESTLALGYDAKKSYDELEKLVNDYKDYLGNSDSEFEAIKKELLHQYTPLEYRVTSWLDEWETGGESQHGANYHSATRYITWTKNKDTGLWEQASSEQLKQLKNQYGKSFIEDYTKANEVIDLSPHIKHRQGLDPDLVMQDSFQKLLEKAGSRPK